MLEVGVSDAEVQVLAVGVSCNNMHTVSDVVEQGVTTLNPSAQVEHGSQLALVAVGLKKPEAQGRKVAGH